MLQRIQTVYLLLALVVSAGNQEKVFCHIQFEIHYPPPVPLVDTVPDF